MGRRPLGFNLDEREVKRAGLDHWDHVDLTVHDSWRSFTEMTFPMSRHDADSDSKTDGGNSLKKSTNVYLVSKRLKLGSYPIADVTFFPQPPPPTAPTAPLATATTAMRPTSTGQGTWGGVMHEGGSPIDGGDVKHDGGRGTGRTPLSSDGCADSCGGGGGGGIGNSGARAFNDVALVFGNEVDGLSGLEEGETGRDLPAVYLPMRDDVIRSYNLSNAVAMAVYEVDRQRRESQRRRR